MIGLMWHNRTSRRYLTVLLAAASLAGAAVWSAKAAVTAGGGDIASAPQLPIGQNVVSGGTCSDGTVTSGPGGCWNNGNFYVEYFRVLALPGDEFTVDIGTTGGSEVALCLFTPTVTDYTLTNTGCTAEDDGINGKAEFKYTFPSAGNWTLAVRANYDTGLGYELTAFIRHYTHTTISAPATVRSRGSVVYRGHVSGTSSGRVELQSRSLSHPVWKTFASPALGAGGSYSLKTKVAASGTYRIRAVYAGDSSHLPSSAIISFKVV